MLMIGDVLISDDIIREQFLCNLNACKGACCWEGDLGAPVAPEERYTLTRIFEAVRPFLRPAGIATIEQEGLWTHDEESGHYATPLIDGGPCAYMVYDDNGIAKCGLEQAYNAGKTDFRKPISCHLYPIRASVDERAGMQALNYDRWDICSAACERGRQQQLPVYQFLREALIRKFGEDFYEELDAAAKNLP
ncbi:MAG: DUF3109 family protein [Phaeodactylibacter sp.]|nr:DUF3109 family protein [Phaeodactylibacter sp.]MCB9297842.1 DUF3109 family protein [Lewinellaceae bacterium]